MSPVDSRSCPTYKCSSAQIRSFKIFIYFMCTCEHISMCMCATRMQEPEEGVGHSGIGVTGGWESADMEAGKQTQAFARAAGTHSCWTIYLQSLKWKWTKLKSLASDVWWKRPPVMLSASNDYTNVSTRVFCVQWPQHSSRGHRGLSLRSVYRFVYGPLCCYIGPQTGEHFCNGFLQAKVSGRLAVGNPTASS